jgi:hypothetical protein
MVHTNAPSCDDSGSSGAVSCILTASREERNDPFAMVHLRIPWRECELPRTPSTGKSQFLKSSERENLHAPHLVMVGPYPVHASIRAVGTSHCAIPLRKNSNPIFQSSGFIQVVWGVRLVHWSLTLAVCWSDSI